MTIRKMIPQAAVSLLLFVLLALGQVSCRGQEARQPAGTPPGGAGRPDPVLSWRHRILPPEDYARLSGEWGAWVKQHPTDGRALVEWGNALRYSGKQEEAIEAYARAFKVAPRDPVAITAHISSTVMYHGLKADWKQAHAQLKEAARLDPDYPDTYYTLWVTSMHEGDEAGCRESLRGMVETGDMPRALLDYGYNMLAGAPPNAIIFTNGDNDTYPPLAMQTLTGLRPDVRIVNISLLNTTWYARRMRDSGVPISLDDAALEALKPKSNDLITTQLQRHILEGLARAGWPRPVLYSVTVPDQNRVKPCSVMLEGVLARVVALPAAGESATELDLARSRELLDTVYRLDSITDPLGDWKREASVARMGWNYVAMLAQIGQRLYESSPKQDGGPYFHRAVALLAFHENAEAAGGILKQWESLDPGAPLLARARALVSGG